MEPSSNRLWIYNRNKEIPFYDVRRIDYICESIPTGIGKLGIANEFDSFRVDSELGKDRSMLRLWNPYCEGCVLRSRTGTMFGDDSTVDLAGD